MSRALRGSFAVKVAGLKRALVEAGGTADPRCDCGQVIPAQQWNLHRARCALTERDQVKAQDPEPTGS